MRASIEASILIVAGAAGAAVLPDFHQPALGAIADRMHTMAVEVVASGGGEKVEVASGVLAGDGIVLTDLRAVLVPAAGGGFVPASGDQLLAIRASNQGAALSFEVKGFSIERAEGDAHRLESAPLPSTFVGAPVFDARGALAGLLVNPSQHDGLLVPAARLREILARVRAAVPQVDDHI
jgi:hypothetical protein